MSDKENTQKKKYTEKPWALPKFIAEKAIKDNLSFKAVAVYKWIYDHNNHAKYLDDDPNAIFTKGSLDALYAAIRRDIDVSVRDICMELRGKGWIEPIKNAPLFKGRRQSGFICRLSKEERLLAKVIQQEMQKEEELPENAKVVESSAQGDADMGEYYQFGIRFYYDEKGEMVQVPLGAPARPSTTALWNDSRKEWYEPTDDGMYHLGRQHWYHIDPDGPDTEGNRQYVPEQFAFNRPSTAHIFDTEGQRWCLPGEETIPPMEF